MTSGNSTGTKRANHWRRIWSEKSPNHTSWYQKIPETSLGLIKNSGLTYEDSIIDVGGGGSVLVDCLLEKGYQNVSVLDIAPEALEYTYARLGQKADRVSWIVADIISWKPDKQYSLWHDRAVFHFLIDPNEQKAYGDTLRSALVYDGQAIVATFALDGPTKCSGLTVQRHDSSTLINALGGGFMVLETGVERHMTPTKVLQQFTWCRLGAT
jgi:hypothetical protein